MARHRGRVAYHPAQPGRLGRAIRETNLQPITRPSMNSSAAISSSLKAGERILFHDLYNPLLADLRYTGTDYTLKEAFYANTGPQVDKFTALPIELQDMIYEYCIDGGSAVVEPLQSCGLVRIRAPKQALLFVCKQIYNNYAQFLLKNAIIKVQLELQDLNNEIVLKTLASKLIAWSSHPVRRIKLIVSPKMSDASMRTIYTLQSFCDMFPSLEECHIVWTELGYSGSFMASIMGTLQGYRFSDWSLSETTIVPHRLLKKFSITTIWTEPLEPEKGTQAVQWKCWKGVCPGCKKPASDDVIPGDGQWISMRAWLNHQPLKNEKVVDPDTGEETIVKKCIHGWNVVVKTMDGAGHRGWEAYPLPAANVVGFKRYEDYTIVSEKSGL